MSTVGVTSTTYPQLTVETYSARVKMQLINLLDYDKIPIIESAINSNRLRRYMPAAGHEIHTAFQFYVWNCWLSEAFYISLHFAEILCRNAVQKSLAFKVGEEWFQHKTFINLLDGRFRSELAIAIADEQAAHGVRMTQHHVASALTFGFWEHLTTKRFDRLIWSRGISHNFLGAHFSTSRQALHDRIESVRRWRNRIAHHQAIFDKDPMKKHQEAIELIHWVCGVTGAWVSASSRVPAVLALRPKP